MSIIRENNKSRGKVYRCFAIYNQELNEFLHIQKRRCNKSYEASIQDVKLQAQKDFQNNLQQFQFKNKVSEWYGLMDIHKKCYFMFMLFPQTNNQHVEKALEQIMKQITIIPNYYLLTPEQLDQLKRSDLRKLIDKLENEYVEQEGGGMGQPSDEEQAGSKIISNTQLIKTNGQSSFRSTINQQQQPSSKIEIKEIQQQNTIERDYIEFGVFRGFLIYSIKDKKILFQLCRGSKQAFPQTLNKITNYIETIKNDKSQQKFIKVFNTKAEWHGKFNSNNNAYYLIMTFQNANEEKTQELINELMNRIKQQDLEQNTQEQVNEKLLWHISTIIKTAEKHYQYDGLGSGQPSDNEQEPKLDQLRKKASCISKNYSTFSATKQQILQLNIVSRADLQEMGEHELSSPLQTKQVILEKLTHFEPQANDTANLLQNSIALTVIILIVIFIYLVQK